MKKQFLQFIACMVLIFLIDNTAKAQITTKRQTAKDSVKINRYDFLDKLTGSFDRLSNAAIEEKKSKDKLDSINRIEVFKMFMSQFDSVDIGKWVMEYRDSTKNNKVKVNNSGKDKKDKSNAELINDITKTSEEISIAMDSLGKLKKEESTSYQELGELTKKFASTSNSSVYKTRPFPEYLQQPDVEFLIYVTIDLIEQRNKGFKNLKLIENSKLSDRIVYNAKPHKLMLSEAEYIAEKNGKTSYCAFYTNDRERSISLKAFLGITEVYITDSPISIAKREIRNTTNYDLYQNGSIIATYIISAGEQPYSSIQIYEPGF